MSIGDVSDDDVQVRKNDAADRYELWVGARRAGAAEYSVDAATRVVTIFHTEVDADLNGRGLGARLVRFALDDIRAGGARVRPACPFVGVFVERNPQYADLIA